MSTYVHQPWGAPYHQQTQPMQNTGWRCPCCGRVYSPTTAMCLHCGPQQRMTASSSAPAAGQYVGQCSSGRLPDPPEGT